MTGPLVSMLFRQAARIRRLTVENAGLRETNRRLAQANGRLRSDVELLALCVHPSRRQVALGFVRDAHRLDRLEETGGQITEETG